MSSDTMNRLRNANPVRTALDTDDALFRAIVATPGDPRLTARVRQLRRPKSGRIRVAIALCVLATGAGAAWAAVGGALDVFEANRQGRDAAPGTLWDQDVRPESIVRAAVLSIPHYGQVEYWYADAEQGGWCGGIRLPDGTWAGTHESGVGGTAPGCYPTRAQTNALDPVFAITGFDYYEEQIDARRHGGFLWRVYYGIVSTDRGVASVVDRITGRRAAVQDGVRFAIAVPDRRTTARRGDYALDLVAYDAAGRVVAQEHGQGD